MDNGAFTVDEEVEMKFAELEDRLALGYTIELRHSPSTSIFYSPCQGT